MIIAPGGPEGGDEGGDDDSEGSGSPGFGGRATTGRLAMVGR
jgi:hypothetical protein